LNGRVFRDTLAVAAAWEGKPLNYARMSRQMRVSGKAARARVQQLADAGLIWLLNPLDASSLPAPCAGAKVRKSPKLYLRRGGGGGEEGGGTGNPFRSRMVRTVCRLEIERRRSSTFWYYGGYGSTHVELIIQTARKRIGFVFLEENRFNRWSWSYCRRILRQGIIQGAFVLYPGHRVFFVAHRMVVLPREEIFRFYGRWINACLGSSRKLLLRLVRSYNTSHAEHLS
jgi:hypothetical protein